MPEYVIILIRGILSFIVLFALARLMGKKQISQLTFFDYIVGISIGSIASSMSADQNIKILNGLVGLGIWGLLPLLLDIVSMKSYRFRQLVDGHATILVRDGKILEQSLRKTKMTSDELMLNLREKQAFHLADVEFAVLETNGRLSVMKKSEARPVTPKDLGLWVEPKHDPKIVVIDGQVMARTLESTGHTREWLLGEVKKQGAEGIEDVFLAQVDSSGNIYVDLYQDRPKQPSFKPKPLLAASLHQIHADLSLFALDTEDLQAKRMYQDQADKLKRMIEQLTPYLKQ